APAVADTRHPNRRIRHLFSTRQGRGPDASGRQGPMVGWAVRAGRTGVAPRNDRGTATMAALARTRAPMPHLSAVVIRTDVSARADAAPYLPREPPDNRSAVMWPMPHLPAGGAVSSVFRPVGG